MERYTKIKYREIQEKSISEYQTTYSIQPLERGLGNTLGTALRRTLLSSVTGIAPFAIRIKGVQHEFQTVEGVVEDVTRIILNVRQLNFLYNSEIVKDGEILKVSFSANQKGDYQYTARDLNMENAGGVTITNYDTEIATCGFGKLEFDLFLTCGRGYRSFEKNKLFILQESARLVSNSDLTANSKLIAVDSDFSPIKKVKIEVNELNSASANIEEELKIDISTNKTVKAKDALSQVAKILIAHLSVIGDVSNLDEDEIFKTEKSAPTETFANNMDISELDLTIRSFNALKRNNITRISELLALTVDELRQIRNLGQKSIKEIMDKIEEHGWELQKGEQ